MGLVVQYQKHLEGRALCYESLLLTNKYMFDKIGINEIRAGILPDNERSICLIKRLDFKHVGESDELEINEKTRTYKTYLLSRSF